MYCLPEVLGFKEKLLYGAVGAAGWLGLTYIFYHDFLTGFISMLPFLYFFFRWIRKSLHEKQIQRIRREFQELIQLLSGAFRTGHSAENAMQEASEQLSMMEGETAYMVQVMQTMLTKMSLGEPAEQVWLSFADACEIEEVKEFAHKVGYPIILKATAGGGGKGMRICRSDEEVDVNMSLCQSEAQNFFGNPDVYAEKFLENPRHIEVQILADQFGNVVHLGERDCSIQRRHQKLLEEAPSPAIDEATRKEMGAAAVRAAKAINYESAGTCEFLLDHDGKWYFMEMNTRIQVEHPITEMICGIDLIKLQLKMAEGLKMPYQQEDIQQNGYALECRINAEDMKRDFAPTPGKISFMHLPGGRGVRVDSAMYNGCEISPYYDSMIGKLICWGITRNEARRRMYRALKEYVITGVETTVPFHQAIIEDPVFISGKFNTGFIEDFYERTGKNKK